uniref:Ribosomal protein S10 n=1 Tax=Nitzschia sp. PL3-2 TaxID=2083271 RepID=A0A2Z5ZAK6_9STRA|nr:ribosomal protein S10 [Nitzschia sp. PL3-2]
MFLYFKISSKDSQVLEKFFQFILRLEKFPMVIKSFSKSKKRKFITILKSPHVNKTAQEQFEFKYYSKEFLVDSLKPLTFFLVIKKIKNLSFPGIRLEVKGLLNNDKKTKSNLKLINPDHIVLNKTGVKIKNIPLSQLKYLQLFDCYGESYLKDLFLS